MKPQEIIDLEKRLSYTSKVKNYSFDENGKLKTISLKTNQVNDIFIIQEFTSLTSLYLSGSGIRTYNISHDVPFLHNLTNLTSLDLSMSQITDISFLQELNNLTTLNLCNNKITDISFLQNLTNLTNLNLTNGSVCK